MMNGSGNGDDNDNGSGNGNGNRNGNGATEQRSNGATEQRSNGATEQRSNGATGQRSNGATEQRSNGATATTNDDNGGNGPDNGERIRDKARRLYEQRVSEKNRNRINGAKKGAKAVGKRLIKPIWDTDKSAKFNGKRLLKAGGRAIVGATVGTAAAAVQAGISITDGKYNPMEGVATFAAGYAGGGVISRGMGSLLDTYRDGRDAGDKDAQMERAKKRFADRDDVIAFNKKNYPGREKEMMQREKEHFLPSGITDLKEMKCGMKYADKLIGDTEGLRKEEIERRTEKADRKAAATMDFRKTLQEQGQLKAVYDKDKRDKYIQTMVDNAKDEDKERVRRQYQNAFKSVVEYDEANK